MQYTNGKDSGHLEIAVPMNSPARPQRVAFQTPWPSKHVYVDIKEKCDEFTVIFSIQAYSGIRPSNQSTPITKLRAVENVANHRR